MGKPTPPRNKGGHAAKPAKPPRKPVEGEDGFGSGHVFEQRKKIYTERDAPVAERKTKG
jgi:hypothetical protein